MKIGDTVSSQMTSASAVKEARGERDSQESAQQSANADHGPSEFIQAMERARRPAHIKPEVDLSRVDPRLREAAEGIESMYLDHMMRVMRQTVPKSELSLENSATELYRSLLDSESAKKAARTQGIGIAEQLIAYYQSQSYNLRQGPRMAPRAREEENQSRSSISKVNPEKKPPETSSEMKEK